MSKRPPRRSHTASDYDWHGEITARQSAAVGTAITEPPRRLVTRERMRWAWLWSKESIYSAAGFAGGTVLSRVQDHQLISLTTLAYGAVPALLFGPVKTWHRSDSRGGRRRELAHARGGWPVVELLNRRLLDGDVFLDDQPSGGQYDDWLETAERELRSYSPALVAEWVSLHDRGRDTPTAEMIQARIDLIEQMLDRVARDGVSLDELARAGFPGAERARLAGA